MRKLTVKNFSVIKDAELEFGKITVLIGPQSSGKSLLCKLAYFFEQVIVEEFEQAIRSAQSIDTLSLRILDRFNEWFPPGAFLGGSSKLEYSEGSYCLTLSRGRGVAGITRSGLQFSPEITTSYERSLQALEEEKISSGGLADANSFMRAVHEDIQKLRTLSDYNDPEVYAYIPSTRAFYVTPPKAILAGASREDEITRRFSQSFDFDFERGAPRRGLEHAITQWMNEASAAIVQGKIEVRENSIAFHARDGRALPLSVLSSGTQELLPLITCLMEFVVLSCGVATALGFHQALHKRRFFVEEPEANVFPSTQYDLVRIFARMANEAILDASWVITTHSPYILSSFNNLLEAWQVAEAKPSAKDEVAKLIEERYWIKPSDFKAYRIHDGKLESIMDEETGLINGKYLDRISNEIGSQFDELLRIGYVET